MEHPCSCGWVGQRAEDSVCGVDDFEVFGMRGIDATDCRWIGISIGMGSLEKIFLNQVREVWMANFLTETMQAVWVVWGYHQSS